METQTALAGCAAATAMDASASSTSQQGATMSASSTPLAPSPAPVARKRTPGRWRRIPRVRTPAMEATRAAMKAIEVLGIMNFEKRNRRFLQQADELEAIDANDCDSEEAKMTFIVAKAQEVAFLRRIARTRPEDVVLCPIQLSDTHCREEHLTAEEMEAQLAQRKLSHTEQVQHFAKLALAHYNARKTTHTYELSIALTSNCFSEACGTTYAHVNFTAVPHKNILSDNADHASTIKRLFFAELMFVPELQLHKDAEPMRVRVARLYH